MNYTCPHCHRPIGLMADADGDPQLFKCPYTNRIAQVQHPIKRDTPPMPKPYEPVVIVRRWTEEA